MLEENQNSPVKEKRERDTRQREEGEGGDGELVRGEEEMGGVGEEVELNTLLRLNVESMSLFSSSTLSKECTSTPSTLLISNASSVACQLSPGHHPSATSIRHIFPNPIVSPIQHFQQLSPRLTPHIISDSSLRLSPTPSRVLLSDPTPTTATASSSTDPSPTSNLFSSHQSLQEQLPLQPQQPGLVQEYPPDNEVRSVDANSPDLPFASILFLFFVSPRLKKKQMGRTR